MNYEKIHHELELLCKEHRNEHVTTMFDYYGMPGNTPGIDCSIPDPFLRMEEMEDMINADIGMANCHFHFMLHEFEGLLFSWPEAFGKVADEEAVNAIEAIRDQFQTPEHINNSPETAPSKRILKIIPGFRKVNSGIIVAKQIGIERMLQECGHFKNWIEEIKHWN